MLTVADTGNGNEIGKVWYNDYALRISKLVNASDMSEIVGDDIEEYETLEDLNKVLADFTFTETPEFEVQSTIDDDDDSLWEETNAPAYSSFPKPEGKKLGFNQESANAIKRFGSGTITEKSATDESAIDFANQYGFACHKTFSKQNDRFIDYSFYLPRLEPDPNDSDLIAKHVKIA